MSSSWSWPYWILMVLVVGSAASAAWPHSVELPTGIGGTVWNIAEHGAVAGDDSWPVAAENAAVVTRVLALARAGDTVLVPAAAGGAFYSTGGMAVHGAQSLTFRIEGTMIALDNTTLWPAAGGNYLPFLHFVDCQALVLTGGGVVDGRGMLWWDENLLNVLPNQRPYLIVISLGRSVLAENLLLHNSPMYHLVFDDCAGAEARNITVHVDRQEMARAKARAAALRPRPHMRTGGDFPLEPQDLNTDGIDPSGIDIWIHDCVIYNDDDSVAVKPCNKNCRSSPCTQNVLIERMRMHGFGASIGSVPPDPAYNCIRNVTMRDVIMPETGKGIYVKSNQGCFTPDALGLIQDLLFQNFTIASPRWWPIWIGPQQMQEPGSSLGDDCSLIYPIDDHCPTQGCVEFRNILLQDVLITDPWLSPGVILGNDTVANMHNISFHNVVVQNPGFFPFAGLYHCLNVDMHVSGTVSPVPSCTPTPG